MTQESMVEKVKSLLRLADNQKGLPEGELAAQIAARLMMQHAIDMDQVVDQPEQIVVFPAEVGRSNWLRILLNQVALFCSCKAWLISGTRTMKVAGYESDLEIASYLFDLIKTQIDFQCRLLSRSGKSAANDFRMSAVAGVSDKLRAIKLASQQEDTTGTGAALVLARSREVEIWVAEHVAGLKQGKGPTYRHDQSGYVAGQNVRLSPGISSKGTPGGFGPTPKKLKG